MKRFLLCLLLFFLWPACSVDAANRFGVCTAACTWDGASTAMWSTSSGGGTGASVPGSGDAVIFDSATCVGGVTCTITVNTTVTVTSISAGACTATTTGCILNFNTNNNNVTVSTISWSGSGTRNINMGSGTFTITGAGTCFDVGTTSGLTAAFSNAPLALTASTASRVFAGGGQTYNSLTIGNNAATGAFSITGTNTFSAVTVGTGTTLTPPQGVTTTITGALTMNGTSASPSGLVSSGPATNPATVSVGSASALTWVGLVRITKAGAGSITATNSLDMGGNTSVTITPPTSGGGGIIGG